MLNNPHGKTYDPGHQADMDAMYEEAFRCTPAFYGTKRSFVKFLVWLVLYLAGIWLLASVIVGSIVMVGMLGGGR